MSPTYTVPAIETIHQGEKLFTRDGHRDLFNTLGLDGPRERARPSSSRSHTYGKKHRSGSPQVHPSLKASPVAVTVDDSRRASCIPPVPRNRLRRNASVDFSVLRDTITGLDEWYRAGSDGDSAQQARELKRARLSPSPRRPTPLRALSDHGTDVDTERSRTSAAKGKEGLRNEAQNEAPEVATSVHGASPNTSEETLRCLEGVPHNGTAEYLNATGGERRSSWAGHDSRMLSPSPSSSSPSSSRTSTPSSVASSLNTVDTEISVTSRDLDGQETPVGLTPSNAHTASNRRSADPDRYGTPEMPRGSAKLPHIPNNGLTPRVPSQNHPKHLPRAEKLPKSGYELLASTISSSAVPSASRNRLSTFLETAPTGRRGNPSQRRHSSASASFFNQQNVMAPPPDEDMTIKPIYRRFEALNHRLLLHLQDELSELEEQLHRLDTTDTQTRRLQSSILPASRRAEFLVGGELQSHKTEILSKIAFKLGQYSELPSSNNHKDRNSTDLGHRPCSLLLHIYA